MINPINATEKGAVLPRYRPARFACGNGSNACEDICDGSGSCVPQPTSAGSTPGLLYPPRVGGGNGSCSNFDDSQCGAGQFCDSEDVCRPYANTSNLPDCEQDTCVVGSGSGSGDIRLTWTPPEDRLYIVRVKTPPTFNHTLRIFRTSPAEIECLDLQGNELPTCCGTSASEDIFIRFRPNCTASGCDPVDFVVDGFLGDNGLFRIGVSDDNCFERGDCGDSQCEFDKDCS